MNLHIINYSFSSDFILKIIILASIFSSQHAQKSQTKIIGGYNVSSITNFRYQVSIRDASHERTQFGSGHMCGGSLIDYSTVLTAAHCVHDGQRYQRPSYYVVVMGNLDLFDRNFNTIVSSISKIIGHVKYNPETFVNDIALMKLKSPVPLNHPTVQPVQLSYYESSSFQRKCVASGWGTTEYHENAKAVRWLQAVNLTVNSRASCNRLSSHAGSVVRGQFCAGSFNGGQDTCQGDSGGPFACDGILFGVTSHGYECGLPNFPGIYMDVAYYRDWIGAASSAQILSSVILFYELLLVLSLTVF